jgi:5-hydroxyisourate hydrolase
MGRLTTHVLDTAHGLPAAGVSISLWAVDEHGDNRRLIRTVQTNADGRTDTPLLAGAELRRGFYELVFDLGAYFATHDGAILQPPFLGRVPVRVGIANVDANYHVPLLASPWSYSTYRGS